MEKILLVCCLLLPLFQLEAQVPIKEEQKLKEASGTLWYANPWLWIAGAALFLVVFLLVLRRATRNRRET